MAVLPKVGVLLPLHSPPSSSPPLHTFLLLHIQNPLCHFHCRTISISNRPFLLVLSSWPLHIRRSRQWDSNAESYITKNFSVDDNGESEDFDESMKQWDTVLEDYIDSIWIFKVFRSFGWMSPLIIISILLATGLKAFLMALALPIGQSTFAFAIQRFQNRGKIKPKLKAKNKNQRSRIYSSRNVELEEEAEGFGRQGSRRRKKGYQSWVSENDISGSNRDGSASNFGGWDELDAGMESNVGSPTRAARKSSELKGTPAKKGEIKKGVGSSGPLLIRLLISMFPFLSSWSKML